MAMVIYIENNPTTIIYSNVKYIYVCDHQFKMHLIMSYNSLNLQRIYSLKKNYCLKPHNIVYLPTSEYTSNHPPI